MFPWVCLATMPLFYPFDWPKTVSQHLTEKMKTICKCFTRKDLQCDDSVEIDENTNAAEVLNSEQLGTHSRQENVEEKERTVDPYQPKVTVCLIMIYVALQAFLPYSHFLTKVSKQYYRVNYHH